MNRKEPTIAQLECFWQWFHRVKGNLSTQEVERRGKAKRGLLINPSGNLQGKVTQMIIESIADGLDLDRREVYDVYLKCINYQPPVGEKLLRPEQVMQQVLDHLEGQTLAETRAAYQTGPQTKLVNLFERLKPERQQLLLQFASFLAILGHYDFSDRMTDLMAEANSTQIGRFFDQIVALLRGDQDAATGEK